MGFRAEEGDLLGATLNIVDQARGLGEAVRSARIFAWLCLIGTAIALTVSLLSLPTGPVTHGSTKRTSTVPVDAGEAPRSSASPDEPLTIEQRLRTLEQIKGAEMISAEEYEASVRRILDTI